MTDPNNVAQFEDIWFDISHNNGKDLDFKALWDSGRRICCHKLTEGTGFVDPMFHDNVQKMIDLDLGFKLAVYHFAHHGQTKPQIDFHISTFVDEVAKLSYEPKFLFMLDNERGANPPLEADVLEFVEYMTDAGIPNPINYGGYDFFSKKWPQMAPCSCMVAAYNSHPISPIPWRIPSATLFGFDFWQYTGDGLGPWAKDIPGGSHNMDLGTFNKAKHPEGYAVWWDNEWAKLAQPK